MHTYQPTLTFKGGRTYVHGTTIYEQIMLGATHLGLGDVDGKVRINLRAQLHHQAEFIYADPSQKSGKPDTAVTDFDVMVSGKPMTGWVQSTGTPVNTDKAYNENLIRQHAVIDDQTITFNGQADFQPIEVSTSMAVQLHQALYPPQGKQKWLLARVTLDQPFAPSETQSMQLELKRIVGNKFTETDIITHGKKCGQFHFLLGDASAA